VTNIFKKILTPFLFAGAICFAHAQDSALLDALAKKAILTEEEAAQIKKQMAEVKPLSENTRKIALSGRINEQYLYLQSESISPTRDVDDTYKGFKVRRLYIGTNSELGSGWSTNLTLNVVDGSDPSKMLAFAYARKQFENDILTGYMDLGYTIEVFSFEEVTPSSVLLTIERSPATRFFTGSQFTGAHRGCLGFGAYYTGAYWRWKFKSFPKLELGFTVTGTQNNTVKLPGPQYGSIPSTWIKLIYADTADFDGEKLSYELGLNGGYGAEANIADSSGCNSGIAGANPYVQIKYAQMIFWADYITAHVERGRDDGAAAVPQGFNVTAEYRIPVDPIGEIAPIFRYSGLFTNGRGIRVRDAVSNIDDIIPLAGATAFYDNLTSIYGGINWYLRGHALKLQLGYEWIDFYGCVGDGASIPFKRAYVHAFRAQLQVLF